jgi:ABC-2 type transport system permease protein
MNRAAIVRLPFWRGVRLVAAREVGATFDSTIAYAATIASLVAVNALFMNEFFLAGKLDMTPFFELVPIVLVLLAPAISMRAWSEDLKTRTFELWMTLPLSPWQVVLGKYAANLVLHAIFLAGTLPIVIMLCALGSPDLGRIAAGYLGAFFLGGAFLALGAFFSSLTPDQITAFLTSAFTAFALLFTGHPRVVAVLDGLAPKLSIGTFLSDHVSCLPHYDAFVRGSIALPACLWFMLASFAFLFATTISVQKNRT